MGQIGWREARRPDDVLWFCLYPDAPLSGGWSPDLRHRWSERRGKYLCFVRICFNKRGFFNGFSES